MLEIFIDGKNTWSGIFVPNEAVVQYQLDW